MGWYDLIPHLNLNNTIFINILAGKIKIQITSLHFTWVSFTKLNSHEHSLFGFSSFDKFLFSFRKLALILQKHSVLQMNVWQFGFHRRSRQVESEFKSAEKKASIPLVTIRHFFYIQPLSQSESWCPSSVWKRDFIHVQIKLIFMWMVVHQESHGNGLLNVTPYQNIHTSVYMAIIDVPPLTSSLQRNLLQTPANQTWLTT